MNEAHQFQHLNYHREKDDVQFGYCLTMWSFFKKKSVENRKNITFLISLVGVSVFTIASYGLSGLQTLWAPALPSLISLLNPSRWSILTSLYSNLLSPCPSLHTTTSSASSHPPQLQDAKVSTSTSSSQSSPPPLSCFPWILCSKFNPVPCQRIRLTITPMLLMLRFHSLL